MGHRSAGEIQAGVIRFCFHGGESTGKSALAAKLSAELGCPWVPEYGREYAEQHGTEFTMADLLAIAEGQDDAMQAAATGNPPLLILDTDPLMTAAWAQMLFGDVPASLLRYPKAELYIEFAADVPWIEDGTRIFGSAAERTRFAVTAHDMLVRADVPFVTIAGDWDKRAVSVRAAIADFVARS